MKTKLEIINENVDKLIKSYPFFKSESSEVVNDDIDFHQWFITTDCGQFDVFDLTTLIRFADGLHLVPSVVVRNGVVAFEMYIFL